MSEQLSLYRVDMKYNRNLAECDDNVLSISPQIGKENRPFIGVLILVNGKQYCAPITSAKPKHNTMPKNFDYLKIIDKTNNNRLIAVINFNNMIPVHSSVIEKIDIRISKNDPPEIKRRKDLLAKELDWCQNNFNAILKNAQKTYDAVYSKNPRFSNLIKRCCDFLRLEQALAKWLEQHTEAK